MRISDWSSDVCSSDLIDPDATGDDKALDRKLHQTIDGIAKDIEALSFNKAVAKIYELANAVEKAAPSASRSSAIRTLALLVAPMTPHLAEEDRKSTRLNSSH